jgi:hypothetical protein
MEKTSKIMCACEICTGCPDERDPNENNTHSWVTPLPRETIEVLFFLSI